MNFQLSTWKNQNKKVRIVYHSGESDTGYIKDYDNIGLSVRLDNSNSSISAGIPYTAILKIYEISE